MSRIDVTDYGIDLPALVEEIKPHLEGMTHAEVGDLAGISEGSARNYINGAFKPSLGAVAALADAAGGRIVVKFDPPKKRSRKRG